MRSVLAADLGGTKCRYALVAEDLTVHGAVAVPTTKDRAAFLARMHDAFDHLAGKLPAGIAAPVAIGIGAAGIVNAARSSLLRAPNLPIESFGIVDHLTDRYGVPVTLLNDGRASAMGEFVGGAAAGADPLLVLFFGTGIGIGVIVGGAPYTGASNAAGEIGHTVYVPNGRRCICGNRGCYEAYCGGGPMTQRAADELGPGPGEGRWTIDALRASEDDRARVILADAETACCAMVASLCTLLNPAAVVLGGGVLTAWPELAERIEAFTRDWCPPAVTDGLVFARSRGGSDAILCGAAAATGAF